MKIILVLVLCFFSINAQAKKITIFACEPEWAALAREIVGEKADVISATRPFQNPALKIEKTLELTSNMMKADVVFCSGGGLENAWLPELLRNSSSVEIKNNKAVLMAYDYIQPTSSRIGDSKDIGRIHLNPNNLLKIAPKFLEIMLYVDQENATFYKQYYKNFDEKFRKQITAWEERSKELKGMKVVVRDNSWIYLVEWLKLDVALVVENENGQEKKLYDMEKSLKENPAKIIIFADFEQKNGLYELNRKTNTRVVLLPFTVGGVIGATDIYKLYDNTLNRLLTDCSKVTCQNIGVRPVMDYLAPNQTIVDQAY